MYVHLKWTEIFVHAVKNVLLYVVEKQKNKFELKYIVTE